MVKTQKMAPILSQRLISSKMSMFSQVSNHKNTVPFSNPNPNPNMCLFRSCCRTKNTRFLRTKTLDSLLNCESTIRFLFHLLLCKACNQHKRNQQNRLQKMGRQRQTLSFLLREIEFRHLGRGFQRGGAPLG